LQNFPFEKPHFDANFSINGLGFNECIVNICTKSVQRRTPFFVFFCTGNLCSSYTATDTDLDTLSACTHGTLNGTLDGTTVVDTCFDLLGNLFADDIRIQFRLTNFEDIDLNLFAREYLELFLDQINLFTTFTNNNAWTAGMNGNCYAAHRTFNSDTRYAILNRLVTIAWISRCCFWTSGT
jgi:hypothetical protein